jgi:hypothetical protein
LLLFFFLLCCVVLCFELLLQALVLCCFSFIYLFLISFLFRVFFFSSLLPFFIFFSLVTFVWLRHYHLVFCILSIVSHVLFVASHSCLLPCCCFLFLACNYFAFLPIASCLLFQIPLLLFCISCLTYLLPLPPPYRFITCCFMFCCLLFALYVSYYFPQPFHLFR